MQDVVFVTTANPNQPVASAAMDVPRQGEQVVIAGQLFTVAAVRFLVYPSNIARAAVLLNPALSAPQVEEQYGTFSRE